MVSGKLSYCLLGWLFLSIRKRGTVTKPVHGTQPKRMRRPGLQKRGPGGTLPGDSSISSL